MTLFVALVVFSLTIESQVASSERPSVDILIPKGMPIRIKPEREVNDSGIVKYVFTRIVSKGAHRARIITVMVDKNGEIKIIHSAEGDFLSDPMSIATADKSVVRILVIVEWVETNRGKWVLDTPAQKVDIESLVQHGVKRLPASRFIVKNVNIKATSHRLRNLTGKGIGSKP